MQQRTVGMADGPETRVTKPESMIFGAQQPALGPPGDPPGRAGQRGGAFTVGRRRYWAGSCRECGGNPVTFSVIDPSFIES